MSDMKSLDAILESHARWLAGDASGTRANLHDADLHDADLRRVNLHDANLRWVNLHDANLHMANLHMADLRGADLHGADLRWADLRWADLRTADLRGVDLRGADLRETVLRNVNLSGANLGNNLEIVVSATNILPEGDLIGWKKARSNAVDEFRIVKLLIPSDAERTNATGRKCRASKAVVLEVQDMDGRALDSAAVSFHDPGFEYRAGETVAPEKPFCTDRWEECASGIHFFITRHEAVKY